MSQGREKAGVVRGHEDLRTGVALVVVVVVVGVRNGWVGRGERASEKGLRSAAQVGFLKRACSATCETN